jgi:signal transduction histidine kinase
MAHAVSGLRRIVDSWASWRDRRAVERSRTTLEQKVAEHTAALSTRNDQLRRKVEELETAKMRAEAASKAKSDFLANMSHELRTPLNAIIGFSDLMKSEVLGPIGSDTYRGYVSDIHFSGCHLLEIINDILDVVRHESGKMELKEEAVAVGDVVADALRLIAPQANEAKVSLHWRPAATALPGLYCDRVRVRQMLLNVLSNAVKFTESGGRVEIKTEVTSGLELIVRDTGIGIRPEDMPHILMPFGQVASVYSRNHQGTGLGLSLTKALVERHGGHLSLHSAPGRGTTVRLSFPPDRLVELQVERDRAIGLGVVD